MKKFTPNIRKMVIYSNVGKNKNLPMLRIANKFMQSAGFQIGDSVEVGYVKNHIIITKKS
jgi:antitoxin component of MazEF toxin-antitoxin module